jgi:micrococcal nuclease
MPIPEEQLPLLVVTIDQRLDSGNLDEWQRKFLVDIRSKIQRDGKDTRLSDKQVHKLEELTGIKVQNNNIVSIADTKYSTPKTKLNFQTISYGFAIGSALVLAIVVVYLFLNTNTPIVANQDSAFAISAREFSITDGDTIRLNGSSAGTRLVGFNTPETFSPQCERERTLGQRATARLRGIVATSRLELEMVACACPPGTQGTDRCNFGRSCGMLRTDGRNVGDILISEGLAVRFVCGRNGCPSLPRPWCG